MGYGETKSGRLMNNNICHDDFYFGIKKKIQHIVNSHQITYYHILLHLFHKRKKGDSQSLGDEIKDTRIYQYWKRESVFSLKKCFSSCLLILQENGIFLFACYHKAKSR